MKADDFEIPFWHEWYEADYIKRHEMIEKLPALQEFAKYLDEADTQRTQKMIKHSFFMIMAGLFEDLLCYTEARKHKEEEEKNATRRI